MRRQHHCAVPDPAAQGDWVPLLVTREPVGAGCVDPELMPLLRWLVVDVEAAAAAACRTLPLFQDDASAVPFGDAVAAKEVTCSVADLPITEPEVELFVLRLLARHELREDRLEP